MILKNNNEVGFIYKNNQNIDKLLNNGNLIFEQGFIREASGSTPLATPTLSTGKNLKNYRIYGNSVQRRLPGGYTEAEYIQSDGNQYIVTNILPTDSNDIILKTEIEITGFSASFGYYATIAGRDGNMQVGFNSAYKAYIGNSASTIGYTLNRKTNVEAKFSKTAGNSYYYIDGENTGLTRAYTNANGIILFSANTTGTRYGMIGKMYSIIFEDANGNLLFNGVPCKNSSNIYGLYDTIGKVFYPSASGTNFTGIDKTQPTTPTQDNPIEIKSVGDKTKNIFDETLFTQYMTKDGDYWVAPIFDVYTNYRRGNRGFLDSYNFKENTSYTVTISGYVSDSYFSIGASYTDGTYETIARLNSTSQEIITGTTDPSKTIDFFYTYYGGNKTLYFKYMQIEEGSNSTDYEPYGKYKIPITVSNGINSSTTNIYLDEPLRKIGDYADYIDFENSKIVKKIYEKKLTSSDTILVYAYASTSFYGFYCRTTGDNEMIKATRTQGFCNYLGNNPETARSDTWFGVNNTSIYMNFPDIYNAYSDNNARIAGFKEWLDEKEGEGKPLLLDYILETPIEESITLPIIPSLKGNITYSIGTEVQPSNMYIKYKGR